MGCDGSNHGFIPKYGGLLQMFCSNSGRDESWSGCPFLLILNTSLEPWFSIGSVHVAAHMVVFYIRGDKELLQTFAEKVVQRPGDSLSYSCYDNHCESDMIGVQNLPPLDDPPPKRAHSWPSTRPLMGSVPWRFRLLQITEKTTILPNGDGSFMHSNWSLVGPKTSQNQR